jgi:hypothetical protein
MQEGYFARVAAVELQRLSIKRPDSPIDVVQHGDPVLFSIITGYRRVVQNDVRPDVEIDAWFLEPPKNQDAVDFWKDCDSKFPLLCELAKANFVRQASGAPSERVWSSADDLSGGDRASVDPDMLDCSLICKKNTPV